LIQVTPTQPVVAILNDVPIAATGWGVTIKEADGSVYRARTTVGVAKVSTSTWSYTGPPVPEVGTYVLVWDDGGAPTPVEATEELIVTGGPSAATDYRPSIADVASVARARTRDAGGTEVGTFTAATRPTGDDVQRLIDLVSAQARAIVGPTVPAVLFDEMRTAIIYGVAALIEASYFPEQNASPDGARATYEALHEHAMETLKASRAAYSASASRGGGIGIGSMRVLGQNGLP